MKAPLVGLTAAIVLSHGICQGIEPAPSMYSGSTLTFYFENDLFTGSDNEYTNGGRLSWISGNRPVEELPQVQKWLRYLIGDPTSFSPFQRISGFEDSSHIAYNYGFGLTQLMYTPSDPDLYFPAPGDRPYAGVLLFDFSLHAMDENVLNTVSLSAGLVGPNSYAETTQDFVHSVVGVDKFNGWDQQIPNEILINLYFDQKRRLSLVDYQRGMFAIDGYTEIGAGIGNYRTEALAGLVIRMGFNLPIEYSDPRLSPQAYSHKLFQSSRVLNADWSLYTMMGVKGHAVAWDVTLDGPLFRDFSTGVDREPFVGEVFAGLGLRYKAWELSYTQSVRTREYDTQDGDHSFGTVAIRKSF